MEKNSPKKGVARWKLLLVLAVCAAPMIASYLTYYVIKPSGRTNYGALIDPRYHQIPANLNGKLLSGEPVGLQTYKGRWLLIQAERGDCNNDCAKKLFTQHQLRAMQGKLADRIEPIWRIADDKLLSAVLMRAYDATRMVRIDAALPPGCPPNPSTQVEDHLYLVDPLGHLMMRFPKDADPKKGKADMSKLLAASAIGMTPC